MQDEGSIETKSFNDDHTRPIATFVPPDMVYESILITDRFEILWCNEVLISNLRCDKSDVVGLECFRVVNEREDPCPTCPAISILENGNPSINQVVFANHETDYVFAYPLADEDGRRLNEIMIIHQYQADQGIRKLAKSDRSLRSFMGSVPDILGIIDTNGTLLFAHRESAFGADKFSIGRNINDILRPVDPSGISARLSGVFTNGEVDSFDIEVEGETQDKEIVNLTLWPIFEDEQVERAYVVARNISWEDETISAIAETEEQFRAIFNEAGIGIILISEYGKIKEVNRTCSRIAGFSADELLSMGIEDITHPEDLPWVADKFNSLLIGDYETIELEYRLLRKDGEHVWVHIHATRSRDGDLKPAYIIVLMEDITQRKELEGAHRYHVAFEQMLQDISAKFNDIALYDIEDGINYALHQVSFFMDASAGFVCLTSDGKGDYFIRYTWTSDEFMTQIPNNSAEEEEPSAQCLEKLIHRLWPPESNDGSINTIESKKALIFREVGLGSCLVVPLFSWGNVLGYIGIWVVDSDTEWNENNNDFLYSVGQVLSFALHRKNQWEESHSFFNESSDLLCIISKEDKRLLKMNLSFRNLLNLHAEDILDKNVFDLVHPADRSRLDHHLDLSVVSNQPSEVIHIRLISDKGHLKWVEMTCKPLPDESTLYCIARDVTEKKRTLLDLKRKKIKYIIEEGRIILAKEHNHPLLNDVMKVLIDIGYQGYVFSRNPDPDIGVNGAKNLVIHWLAESDHVKSTLPSVDAVLEVILKIPSESVVLLDRLDYLISKQGFDDVLTFVNRLGEVAYLNDLIVLISIDPMTISSRQLRMIEKECSDLQPIHTHRLDKELMDLLRIVHLKTISNLHTSYEDLTRELGISKPTVRKRLATLIYLGYMTECLVGRKKVFTITDKGLNLLSG